jgi:hypothetical protein
LNASFGFDAFTLVFDRYALAVKVTIQFKTHRSTMIQPMICLFRQAMMHMNGSDALRPINFYGRLQKNR